MTRCCGLIGFGGTPNGNCKALFENYEALPLFLAK